MSRFENLPALAPFRVRSYRYQWPADALTSWAFEMETLILGWYVLTETGSVLWLTVFASLQFVGTLLAPLIGVIADRIGRRALLAIARSGYGVLAALIMVLAFADLLTATWVLVITFLAGLGRPSDWSMRNALIGDTMPGSALAAAMGLNRMTWDTARIAGAMVGAGLFATLGIGPAYILVTAFYAAGVWMTLKVVVPPRSDTESDSESDSVSAPLTGVAAAWHELRESIVFVWQSPTVLALMALAFLINLLAFPVTMGLLPHVAKEIYAIDQIGLGHLVAAYAGGALLGSIAMTLTGGPRRTGKFMVLSIAAWYLAILAFGWQETELSGVAVLVVIGFVQNTAAIALAVILLTVTPQEFRGRVMGVRILAVYGLPTGLLGYGVLIDWFGFASAMTVGAVIGVAVTAYIGVRWREAIWR
jgi:MFS family permease